jgi:hypothetical protein
MFMILLSFVSWEDSSHSTSELIVIGSTNRL